MTEVTKTYGTCPFSLFAQWYKEAQTKEPSDPDAASLATVSKDNRPHNRMVLIKEASDKGFKFHTNTHSIKGQDIEAHPNAALCFHWKSLDRQVRIEGNVQFAPDSETDAYFEGRSPERKIGAWASRQSEAFASQDELMAIVKANQEKYKDITTVPRPPHWKGYLVIPQRIEFWIGNKDRLHTRFQYVRNDAGNWDSSWLFP